MIQDAKEKAFAANAKMMIKAIDYKMLEDPTFDPTDPADLNINNIESVLGVDSANMSAFTVAIENGKPSVSISGDAQWSGLSASGTFAGIVVIDTTAIPNYTYYSTTEGVNVPQLATGMTPIKWDASNNEVTTTVSDPNWYDYTTKKWANAKTADGSYWVWIPRYAYRITTGYQSNTTGTIDVKFLTDTSNTSADGTSIVAYSNGNSATNFVPHPAFNFGGTQVTGMWVAKFEASNNGGKVASKPNVKAWTQLYRDTMYFNTVNMEKESSHYGFGGTDGSLVSGIDTHMMKNTEWGAVAYLSKSNFGKVTEVWINNIEASGSTTITGCSGNSAKAATVVSDTCPVDNQYNKTIGFNASTTGNITGIYDMVGGTADCVMAFLDEYDGLETTLSSIPEKHIDKYFSITGFYGYNYSYYGDAVFETSANLIPPTSYYLEVSSWYDGKSYMPFRYNHWFARGGNYQNYQNMSGLFEFEASSEVVLIGGYRPMMMVAPAL